jgi:hypothetical protein
MTRAYLTAILASALYAQPGLTPESLSGWRFYKEVEAPRNANRLADFVLDRDVLDQAKSGAEDLRLYDSRGREVPYALRIRRDVDTSTAFPAREYNRSTEGGAAQLFLDLGAQPQQHNQVEIDTAGNNFRRTAEIQGSPDDSQWSTLAANAILFRFAAGGRTVEQNAVDYPVSRFRYLRVRVARDPETDNGAPEVTGVRVRRSVQVRGEMAARVASLNGREPDRVNGRPASIWRIDLGGRIPIQRVILTVASSGFSRPFELDEVDDPASPQLLASGELTRQDGPASGQLTIDFAERFARQLRLVVTDDRNEALNLVGFLAYGAARQVIFDPAAAAPGTMRLYYGNPRALAPRYDLAARLPVQVALERATLGPQHENPLYRPEPKPFSERSPWLVYVVLGAAGAVLAGILLSLARASREAGPATPAAAPPSDPA